MAIEKAEHSSTGLYEEGLAQRIADEIEEYATKLQKDMTIYAIEDQVYYKLIEYHNPATHVPMKVTKLFKLLNVVKILQMMMYWFIRP